MNEEMKTLFNALVEEMGCMEERINKRFETVDDRFNKLDQRLDSMQHDIRRR